MRYILTIALLFAFALTLSGCTEKSASEEKAVAPIEKAQRKNEVTGKKTSDLRAFRESVSYTGQIVSDFESTITAKAGGTITNFSLSVGRYLRQGSFVATIDDTGNFVDSTKRGFKSAQIQQLYLAKESAEKTYKQAKRAYDASKTNADKTARDIAKMQLESAQLSYENALDSRTVTSPISGSVTQVFVSVGDSVNAGDPLVALSKTSAQKVRFFADSRRISDIRPGMEVKVTQNGKTWNARITSVAPQAEQQSGKFLVEALPMTNSGEFPLSGVSVSVSMEFERVAKSDFIYVPLSAIRTTQAGNFVFADADGKAAILPFTVESIEGETALGSLADSDAERIILLEGSRLLKEGDPVSITE